MSRRPLNGSIFVIDLDCVEDCSGHVEVRHERLVLAVDWATRKLTVVTGGNWPWADIALPDGRCAAFSNKVIWSARRTGSKA
ncbi:MAG: hypothetical protein Q7U28_11545 [Aquabacterium sp.]|nr:hypothetical protein [Aquabacterium sp.]